MDKESIEQRTRLRQKRKNLQITCMKFEGYLDTEDNRYRTKRIPRHKKTKADLSEHPCPSFLTGFKTRQEVGSQQKSGDDVHQKSEDQEDHHQIRRKNPLAKGLNKGEVSVE